MLLPADLVACRLLPLVELPATLLFACRAVYDAGRRVPVLIEWIRRHSGGDASCKQRQRAVQHLCSSETLQPGHAAELLRLLHYCEDYHARATLLRHAVVRDWPEVIAGVLAADADGGRQNHVDDALRVLAAAAEVDRDGDVLRAAVEACRPRTDLLHEAACVAARHGSQRVLRAILEAGAAVLDANARCCWQGPRVADSTTRLEAVFEPLLHAAVAGGHDAIARMLVDERGCRLPNVTVKYYFRQDHQRQDWKDEAALVRRGLKVAATEPTLVVAVRAMPPLPPETLKRIAAATADGDHFVQALWAAARSGNGAAFDLVANHYSTIAEDRGRWAETLLARCSELADHPAMVRTLVAHLDTADGGGYFGGPTSGALKAILRLPDDGDARWALKKVLTRTDAASVAKVAADAIAHAAALGCAPFTLAVVQRHFDGECRGRFDVAAVLAFRILRSRAAATATAVALASALAAVAPPGNNNILGMYLEPEYTAYGRVPADPAVVRELLRTAASVSSTHLCAPQPTGTASSCTVFLPPSPSGWEHASAMLCSMPPACTTAALSISRIMPRTGGLLSLPPSSSSSRKGRSRTRMVVLRLVCDTARPALIENSMRQW